MGGLWLYAAMAAVVLPVLLLKQMDIALLVLLVIVLLSLVVVAIEADLRPAGFARSVRGMLPASRRNRTTPPSGDALSGDALSGDNPAVSEAAQAEMTLRTLERERLLFLVVAVVLAVVAALLFNRRTNLMPTWQGGTGFLLASFVAMGGAVSRWRMIAAAVQADTAQTDAGIQPGDIPSSDTVPASEALALPAFAMPTTQPLAPARSNGALTAFGVVLLLLLAEINGKMLDIDVLRGVPYWLQAIFFYGGLALVAAGLGGVPLRLPAVRWPSREVWLLLALFVFAFAVRLHQLDHLRASFDEAIPINAISNIWYPNEDLGIVSQPSSYVTTLVFSQWQALAIGVVGKNIIGLRIVSVLVGALTCVVVALLGRDLFDRRTGWIAGLLLAVFPPHVHFSRIALLHIADPLMGALAIWFVVRGLKYNRRIDWALAGISLGMTQYFFEAGRLFFIPLIVIWLVVMLFLWRERLRPQRHGLVIMAVALIFTAMPAYYSLFAKEASGTARLTSSAVGASYWTDIINRMTSPSTRNAAANELIGRLLFPLQVFVRQPEMAIFYGGEQPMLLVYVVPFFLMGLSYLLWRFHPAALIAFGWPLATAAVNILMRDQAHFPRWVVGMPGMMLAAAVGFRYILPGMIPRVPMVDAERRQVLVRRMRALSSVLLVVLLAGQIVYYHRDHVPELMRQIRLHKPDPDTIDAALRVPDLPPNTDIYFVSDPIADIHPPRAWINFLTPPSRNPLEGYRLYVMTPQEFTPAFLAGLSTHDRNYAFFIQTTDTVSNALLKRTFTTVQAKNSPYPIDPPQDEFILYAVLMGAGRY